MQEVPRPTPLFKKKATRKTKADVIMLKDEEEKGCIWRCLCWTSVSKKLKDKTGKHWVDAEVLYLIVLRVEMELKSPKM